VVYIPLTNSQKNLIYLRILGYNVLSFCYILIGFTILVVGAIFLFFRVGPKEQYYFPVIVVALVALLSCTKTIALNLTKAEKVEDLILLSWYDEVAVKVKLFGIIPLIGFLRPTLYHAKMGNPNAFACGLNLFGLAQLPFFGSAVVLSDELISMLSKKQQMQAVIAHELGHIVSFDVGISSGLALLGSLFSFFYRAGWLLRVFISVEFLILLPIILVWYILRATLSKLRELVADLKAVLAVDSVDPLIEAFSRIAEFDKFPSVKDSIMGDLFLSHPKMKDRTLRLREIGKKL
jgi:Zn-dependent protease with chaperone function